MIEFDKVKQILVDGDTLEKIWQEPCKYDDFWADYEGIIENETMKSLVSDELLEMLRTKEIDYIAFRGDW